MVKKWKKSEVYGLDCEFVALKGIEGIPRIKAGSVAVVNHKGESVYSAKIYHKPGTFLVNDYTINVNGFHEDSLKDGEPLHEVKTKVDAIIAHKLTITHSGTVDFASLELNRGTLRKLRKDANPFKKVGASEQQFQTFWKNAKGDREQLLSKKQYLELKIKSKPILQLFRKSSLTSSVPRPNSPPTNNPVAAQAAEPPETRSDVVDSSNSDEGAPTDREGTDRVIQTKKPAQERIKQDLGKFSQMGHRIIVLRNAKDAGLLSEEHRVELQQLTKKYSADQKRLARLKSVQKAQRKFQKRRRKALLKLKEENPQVQDGLAVNPSPGRPRVEESQPGLMDAIIDVVSSFCTAHERRRTESMRYVKTLDDLLLELQEMGYNISRSGLYYRLLPRNSASNDGKRHTMTVPVKLCRPQNSLRKEHEDSHFASATIKYLKDISTALGNECVFVLSQDDKARVPLGLPAENKQGALLMKVDYKVTLPDHDWVVATRHKLIPSVYAGLEIRDSAVSYSGPTYIAIRSGKHDSSTAMSHAIDLARLVDLPSFKGIAISNVKVFQMFVDGGPDENPRFPKTLSYAVQHFLHYKLDALFIATHAPYQSAYNPVERRMAPLSRDLCGVILPHDHFGKHLDKAGKTINLGLEKQNFRRAGMLLADIWSQRVIDDFEVEAEYINPPGNGADTSGSDSVSCYVSSTEPAVLTEEWKVRHVRQTNYLLQISKCNDINCCGRPKTNLRDILKGQFLPPPVRFIKTMSGIAVSAPNHGEGSFRDIFSRIAYNFLVPPNTVFDSYCPSVRSKLHEKICSDCKNYFVTKKALISHKRVHKNSCGVQFEDVRDDEVCEDLEENLEGPQASLEDENIFQIKSVGAWYQSPFVDDL